MECETEQVQRRQLISKLRFGKSCRAKFDNRLASEPTGRF